MLERFGYFLKKIFLDHILKKKYTKRSKNGGFDGF